MMSICKRCTADTRKILFIAPCGDTFCKKCIANSYIESDQLCKDHYDCEVHSPNLQISPILSSGGKSLSHRPESHSQSEGSNADIDDGTVVELESHNDEDDMVAIRERRSFVDQKPIVDQTREEITERIMLRKLQNINDKVYIGKKGSRKRLIPDSFSDMQALIPKVMHRARNDEKISIEKLASNIADKIFNGLWPPIQAEIRDGFSNIESTWANRDDEITTELKNIGLNLNHIKNTLIGSTGGSFAPIVPNPPMSNISSISKTVHASDPQSSTPQAIITNPATSKSSDDLFKGLDSFDFGF